MCSFGDASVNHSTAVGAVNTACWVRLPGLPMPLLFVCEDNGIGISVRTPPGWIDARTTATGPGSRTSRPTAPIRPPCFDAATAAAD